MTSVVLQRLRRSVDTLSLRERGMLFAGSLLALLLAGKLFVFDPQYARQQTLRNQINADTTKSALLHAEIEQLAQHHGNDADAVKRATLAALQSQSQSLRGTLSEIHAMLVRPDEMTALLADILKRNKRLRLVSFATLPTVVLAGQSGESNTVQVPGAATSIYKHGVEIVVQGNYLDMMSTMTALEAMPARLFWTSAVMRVDTYPDATLTLTLFTLSLDKKWLSL